MDAASWGDVPRTVATVRCPDRRRRTAEALSFPANGRILGDLVVVLELRRLEPPAGRLAPT